jgi:saccharopine dehydrogenase (NAD+, L-lysine forming)
MGRRCSCLLVIRIVFPLGYKYFCLIQTLATGLCFFLKMKNLSSGLIKEGKKPSDSRVALSPEQAALLQKKFPHVNVHCQSSATRCFSDQEYKDVGINVVPYVDHCDILLGIKEVPVADLVPGKTYLFFSHTIKKQSYNRQLLQEILKSKIRLIDYECMKDPRGNRILGFGRFAGIVGAYNGILTYGLKKGLFRLKRARNCRDYDELREEYHKVVLPPIKIILTGSGRVANGAIEVLESMGIKKVWPREIINKEFGFPVYAQLFTRDYHYRKDGNKFNVREFYQCPDLYFTDFSKYLSHIDLFIAGSYWDPRGPALFSIEDMRKKNMKLKVTADITCDIEGSIPSTKKATTIDEPIYDYNPYLDTVEPPFSGNDHVSVMAIDNLPNELPRDASIEFGQCLINSVLPYLFDGDEFDIIKKATITEQGGLTKSFYYLKDFAEGLE